MWPLEKGHMWRLSYQGFLRYHLTALSVIQFEGRSQAEDMREQPGASAGGTYWGREGLYESLSASGSPDFATVLNMVSAVRRLAL